VVKQSKMVHRSSVKMRVRTPVEIPWNSKKGTQFILRWDGEIIGEVLITGAHISVRGKNKHLWREYDFQTFIKKLS
jgi:hypothetical protein